MIQVVQTLFSAFALVLLLASTAGASNKPCIAAKMDDLSTVWVGETLGDYFRLQINPDGTGLLTAQWVMGKAANAYKVTETNLSDRRVGFRLESLDDVSESLYLRGTACRGLLDLHVGSNSPKWKLDVIFQPQARLMERQQAVTSRAEEYAAQGLPQPALQTAFDCRFPGQERCSDRHGRWSVQWREPHGGVRHELWLTSVPSGKQTKFLQFDRSVDLLWSPDGRALAIADHSGSSDTVLWVASGGNLTRLINVEDQLRASLGRLKEIYESGHRYFEPVRWLSAEQLIFRVRAYDSQPGNEFNALFRYDLVGRVSRETPMPLGSPVGTAQLDETARHIAALEKLDPGLYFDMHGNAHDQLQALMIARFSATAGITQSIDRLESTKERSEFVGALYDALGFVKDPASIPWLRSKVVASDPNPFYSRYLPKWRDIPEGYGTWEWLEGRERWIEFFVWTFSQVHDDRRRTEILEVLSGFDDPSVRSFFNGQDATALSPRERLIVSTYLHFHGDSPNEQRIHDAIESLAGESRNRQFLIEMAHHLRHPAFVPFLISIADDQPDKYSRESLWNAQDALEKSTFEVRAKGKAQWEQWYARFGRAGREKWLERALESMRQMIRENEKEAVNFFDTAVYSWDDIALLSFVENELAPRSAFRDNIAGWINLTYRPVYRSRLEPLAKKIAVQSKSLAPWARQLLVERGFLPPGPKSTWREYVRASNMRI